MSDKSKNEERATLIKPNESGALEIRAEDDDATANEKEDASMNYRYEQLLAEKDRQIAKQAAEQAAAIAEQAAEKDRQIAKQAAEIAEKDRQIAEQAAAIAEKDGQNAAQRRPYIVPSVSAAAANQHIRGMYHEHTLQEENIPGAFVGHQYYTEFVKAARRMTTDTSQEQWPQYANIWGGTVEKVDAMFKAMVIPLQESDRPDEEAPQSFAAAQLIGFALSELATPEDEAGCKICVGHQYCFVKCFDLADILDSEGTSKEEENSESMTSCKAGKNSKINVVKEKRKLVWNVDIAILFFDKSQEQYRELALAEYKPDPRDEVARITQGNMYATNTCEIRERPCIAVDIAGGSASKWQVNAWAIVPSLENGAKYIKSRLLKKTGAEGIVSLAAGLLHAKSFYSKGEFTPTNRLGPVVGLMNGNKVVVKAYDQSSYRQPNVEWVKKMVDPEAVLWKNTDSDPAPDLFLLEMKYIDSNWNEPCDVRVFVDLLKQLLQMHKSESPVVHGDVRLANMLSTGVLIDFDFVGREKYPKGLRKIDDGARHPAVCQCIDHNSIDELVKEPEHDLFSMGAVMDLFKPQDNEKLWADTIKILQTPSEANDDRLSRAIDTLKPMTATLVDYQTKEPFKPRGTGSPKKPEDDKDRRSSIKRNSSNSETLGGLPPTIKRSKDSNSSIK